MKLQKSNEIVIRLPQYQIDFLSGMNNRSRYIQSLLDKEMSRALVHPKHNNSGGISSLPAIHTKWQLPHDRVSRLVYTEEWTAFAGQLSIRAGGK